MAHLSMLQQIIKKQVDWTGNFSQTIENGRVFTPKMGVASKNFTHDSVSEPPFKKSWIRPWCSVGYKGLSMYLATV